MDFHEVLCDKKTNEEPDHGKPSGMAGEDADADATPSPDTVDNTAAAAATSADDDVGPGGTNAEVGVVMEAAVVTAAASAADVVVDAVADEMVVDALGELLMGLHLNLFGTDDSGANIGQVDATLPASPPPKFKSVKKRVGGGFIYVQMPDDGTDGDGAGTGEAAEAAEVVKEGKANAGRGADAGVGSSAAASASGRADKVVGGSGSGNGSNGGKDGDDPPFAKLPRRTSFKKDGASRTRLVGALSAKGADEDGNDTRLPRLNGTKPIPTPTQSAARRSRRPSGSAGGGVAVNVVRSLREREGRR